MKGFYSFLAGVWLLLSVFGEDIKVKKYDVDFDHIVWTAKNGFLMGNAGSVYVSKNDFDWTKLELEGINSVYGNKLTDELFFFSRSGSSFYSADGGTTFTKPEFPGTIRKVLVHPSRNWMLLQSVTSLYVSRDFGQTYELVVKDLPRRGNQIFTWGDAGYGSVPLNRMYYILDSYTNMEKTYKSVFLYTDDFGKTLTPVFENVIGLVWLHHFLLLGVIEPGVSREIDLYVSHDSGKGIPMNKSAFKKSIWPFHGELPNNGYSVLDGGSGSIWTAVNHGSVRSHWGNLYNTGAEGVRNVLVQPHLRDYWGNYDFTSLQGLEGIFVSNNLTNYYSPESNPLEGDLVQTFITFDNGGEWKYLTPPSRDAEGQPFSCTPTPEGGDCHLHLHGMTSYLRNNYGPFYSMPNAIGLIIATGSVGKYLDHTEDLVGTFLSRDAGVTWKQIQTTSTIYEYGDHGGILVFAHNNKATRTIKYTLDEGRTFKDYTFVDSKDEEVEVENIRIEPKTANTKFLIHGKTKTSQTGVVYALDFSNLIPRECGPSDYENWSPTDGDKCVMGRIVTYKRKKQSVTCLNKATTTHAGDAFNCNCSREDYECDFDYAKNQDGTDTCHWVGQGKDRTGKEPYGCFIGQKYLVTKGYRKVADNSCVMGKGSLYEYSSITCVEGKEAPADDSSGNSGGSGAAGTIIAIVLIILVGGGLSAGLMVVYKTHEPHVVYLQLDKVVTWVKSQSSPSQTYQGVDHQYEQEGLIDNEEDGLGEGEELGEEGESK